MVLMIFNNCEARASQLNGFIFVRHGESQWNATMIDLGPQDLPLSALGKSQAEECAHRLKQSQQIKIVKMYSSPLLRAKETAEILRKSVELPILTEQGLEERYFGDHRLLSIEERNSRILPPDAESREIFDARVIATVSRLINSNKNGIFIIVAHEKVFECLADNLCKRKRKISFGSAYFFQRQTCNPQEQNWQLHELDYLQNKF